jgi:hypothetical protein
VSRYWKFLHQTVTVAEIESGRISWRAHVDRAAKFLPPLSTKLSVIRNENPFSDSVDAVNALLARLPH